MIIPVHHMQATGEFSVPGTRHTVNAHLVRQAAGRLPLRERREAFDCVDNGDMPSEKLAEALRQLIVELAEKAQERNAP